MAFLDYEGLQRYTEKVKEYVGNLVGQITKVAFEVVSKLPDTGEPCTIYFVPSSDSSDSNAKDEFIWIDGEWEQIGTTLGYAYDEGQNSFTIGNASTELNGPTKASGQNSFATGCGTKAEGNASEASGYATVATGSYSHAEGFGATSEGNYSHAEGYYTQSTGSGSHAEGYETQASNINSHAEGYQTVASGKNAHAEGSLSHAAGDYSHAEGSRTYTFGNLSHAEGYGTKALVNGAHAEGDSTTSYGRYSHVEGGNSQVGYDGDTPTNNTLSAPSNTGDANGGYAHAEGGATLAVGKAAHAEGWLTFAQGNYSHAEGDHTVASGSGSHAEGYYTQTTKQAEHAQGTYNKSNTNTIHSIGIGVSNSDRQNAVEVMNDGEVYIKGIGGYSGTNPFDSNSLQDVLGNLVNDSVESTTSTYSSQKIKEALDSTALELSNKVNKSEFEEATEVTAASLNLFNSTILWQTEDGYVKCDKTKTESEALSGEADVLYFTTDTHKIILNGAILSQQDLTGYATEKYVDDNTVSALEFGNLDSRLSTLETSPYTLPTASATELGGIKVGNNLTITDGVLSAIDTTYNNATTDLAGLMSSADKTKIDSLNNYTLPIASQTVLGGIKIDGTTITIDGNGVISAESLKQSIDELNSKLQMFEAIKPTTITYSTVEAVPVVLNKAYLTEANVYMHENSSILFDAKIRNIWKEAFYGNTELLTINIPNDVNYIGQSAFLGCTQLQSIEGAANIRGIQDSAFYGCSNLQGIPLLEQLTTIGEAAFKGCRGITQLTLPNSLKTIGASAFEGCSTLSSIVLGTKITDIYMSAFKDCVGLTEVIIPDSVLTLGTTVFQNCTSLQSIIFGAGLTNIGGGVLNGCTALKTITCMAPVPPAMNGGNYLTNVTEVRVPADSVDSYKVAAQWSLYASIIKSIS